VPLVMDWRGLVRAFRDVPSLLRGRGDAEDDLSVDERVRFAKPLVIVSLVVMVVVGHTVFHLSPVATLIGFLLAVVLGNVCGRSAGETDLAPTGALGTLTQLTFTGNGHIASLFAASITSGVGAQTAQTLWALRTGNQLKASPRAQVWAQILGVVLGAVVSVPVYYVLVKAYGLGTEAMPAVSAQSWKATAEAVRDGLSTMPRYAVHAGSIGFCVGVVFAAMSRGRWGRFVPSPAAMGMAALSPFSLSFSVCVGGVISLLISRASKSSETGSTLLSIAAGGIAGESIMGVTIAILLATGLL
jgi:uncharacterized oligopeptide transporter (OPT) family protein